MFSIVRYGQATEQQHYSAYVHYGGAIKIYCILITEIHMKVQDHSSRGLYNCICKYYTVFKFESDLEYRMLVECSCLRSPLWQKMDESM